jgi:hypothetical protein
MRIGKPSPAMVVAVVALFMATTGTAAAVVSFARNAGAVDGKSGYAAGVSTRTAAGDLVATARRGPLAGKIPARYLDLGGLTRALSFGRASDVIDNATESAIELFAVPGLGTLTTTCRDENPTGGREDPVTRVTFSNTAGEPINFARTAGTGTVLVQVLQPNQAASFEVRGSNTYVLNVQRGGTSLVVNGAVRQDGTGSAAASCLNYGQAVQAG